jgi:hypothetical protein
MIQHSEVLCSNIRKVNCEKIKVIAVDMDGTLLNSNHELDQKTYKVIKKAQDKGIRFIIVTGRDYCSARIILEKYNLLFDYILATGAEIRNLHGDILENIPMKKSCLIDIYRKLEHIPVMIRFCANGIDYFIGSREAMMKGILEEIKAFDINECDEVIRQSEVFKQRIERFCCMDTLEELFDKEPNIYKIYISSDNIGRIKEADELLKNEDGVSSASSFSNNLEITDIKAQKGIVLKKYIEQLGYSMSEVMAIGDSMNDYSMISMDFGMTVAMENSIDKVKKTAKYITKSNEEFGVAYAIEKFCGI